MQLTGRDLGRQVRQAFYGEEAQRVQRHSALEAARAAGVARFRPVILISLTTFVGLMPLLVERSMQAQFLIPMAVSLGFGVLFATLISLLLVPAGYLAGQDLVALVTRRAPAAEAAPERAPQPTVEAPAQG